MRTIRNDSYSAEEFIEMAPQGFIISPGPGEPDDAGVIVELIQKSAGTIPLFGVCLGMQAIVRAFNGELMRVDPPVHGKLSIIEHENTGVFADVPNDIPVTRYHSLCADITKLPDELAITAKTKQGLIMGVSHKHYAVHGVQFHPESIASVGGYRMLANFLAVCGHNLGDEAEIAHLEEQIIRLDKKFPEQLHV